MVEADFEHDQPYPKKHHVGHPMHPALVHFPITLFPLSLLFLALMYWTDNAFHLHAAYWSFMLGVLMIIPVLLTGVRDLRHVHTDNIQSERLLYTHVYFGALISIISILSGIYFLLNKPFLNPELISGFTIISLLLTIMMFVQGFLGGLLVYTHHLGTTGHTTD